MTRGARRHDSPARALIFSGVPVLHETLWLSVCLWPDRIRNIDRSWRLAGSAAGLEAQCPGDRMRTWNIGPPNMDSLQVAAIINWYGITDLVDLLDNGPGTSGNFTEAWLGSSPDRRAVAERVSPLSYVRRDLPPV